MNSSMGSLKRRVAKLLHQAKLENIPVEDRFWLDLAETPEQRAEWAAEHVTWADVERDWDAAAELP